MPVDFGSLPQTYRVAVAGFIEKARELVHEGKPLEAVLFVGRLEPPQFHSIEMDPASAVAKAEAGEHGRMLAKMLNADYALMVCEAWSVPESEVRNANAILDRYESLAHYPGRIEVAAFSLETRYGVWAAQAQLKAVYPSKRRRTFGPVRFVAADYGDGRLANILEHDPDRADGVPVQ